MARQIQIRRGTATENDNFTGAIGEVTMDTTNKTLRVHDGETLGGTVLAKQHDLAQLNMFPRYADTENIVKPTQNRPFTPNYKCWVMTTIIGAPFRNVHCVINGKTFRVGTGNGTSFYQTNNIGFYMQPGDTLYFFEDSGSYEYHIYVIPLSN